MPDATLRFAAAAESASAPVQAAVPVAAPFVWWLIAGGMLAGVLRLSLGMARLRQLRRRSRPAVIGAELEALRGRMAQRAELRASDELSQPAGFGLRRPVVLLPRAFFRMEPEAQRAVLCHELLHVARRDWPWIVVEELARALCWFHPAVWWLVERIQSSREQLIDRLVVEQTSSKRPYMRALLSFADARSPGAAATAFLHRRQLRSRLQHLAKEPVMSRTALIWTAAASMCVMGAGAAGTVTALPLGRVLAAAPAQEVANGKDPGVTRPKVVSEAKPSYTPEALQAGIEGTVLMEAVVRGDGTVGDVDVTRSLDTTYGLDERAVAALRQWRFEPGQRDGKPVAVRVVVEMTFTLRK